MGHIIVYHSPTVIVLTTQTRISHHIHVYFMIGLFYVFRSVSYALYGILDTWNLDLSLQDLLGVDSGTNFKRASLQNIRT